MSSTPECTIGRVLSDRLLTFQQLSDKVGMKRTAIYAAISAGTFPVPIKIGKLSRWAESEVDTWIENLKRQRIAAASRCPACVATANMGS